MAALVVAVLLAVSCAACGGREGFASPRAHAVAGAARELFDRTGGSAGYSEYKRAMPPIARPDAVQHHDVRQLWQRHQLNPEAVEVALH